MVILITILIALVTFVAAYLIHGWSLFYLWQWYVVPLGLPQISMPWAIGLGVLVGYLTNHETEKKGQETDLGMLFVNTFLRPLLALGVGWLIHVVWGPF